MTATLCALLWLKIEFLKQPGTFFASQLLHYMGQLLCLVDYILASQPWVFPEQWRDVKAAVILINQSKVGRGNLDVHAVISAILPWDALEYLKTHKKQIAHSHTLHAMKCSWSNSLWECEDCEHVNTICNNNQKTSAPGCQLH